MQSFKVIDMTNEEAGRIKLEVVEELAELRVKLTCLKTKAERLRNQLLGGLGILEPVVPNGLAGSLRQMRADTQNWPGYEDLTALVEEYGRTQERVDDLTERCRQWNILD